MMEELAINQGTLSPNTPRNIDWVDGNKKLPPHERS